MQKSLSANALLSVHTEFYELFNQVVWVSESGMYMCGELFQQEYLQTSE